MYNVLTGDVNVTVMPVCAVFRPICSHGVGAFETDPPVYGLAEGFGSVQ